MISPRPRRRPLAFTIVEMLVVVAIIAALIGVLLPAVSRARNQAKVTTSQSNLRNLATAHASYAADHDGRQLTVTIDTIATYGTSADQAANIYKNTGPTGNFPPGIPLGWGERPDGTSTLEAFWIGSATPANYRLMEPIVFDASDPNWPAFGWFRIPNVRPFTEYLSRKFYDKVFYAPADTVVTDLWEETKNHPGEYVHSSELGRTDPIWSSYCLSPAALFSPDVMRNPDKGGWQDPWSLKAGFRAPALSQATYAHLKTHMLEHNWIQNRRTECNSDATTDWYENGCEPYQFNHNWESSPNTLFYDGHVEPVGVRAAQRVDLRHEEQTGYGLWSRDTPLGLNGYRHDIGYWRNTADQARTSFHILTTDGIKGRDVIAE